MDSLGKMLGSGVLQTQELRSKTCKCPCMVATFEAYQNLSANISFGSTKPNSGFGVVRDRKCTVVGVKVL